MFWTLFELILKLLKVVDCDSVRNRGAYETPAFTAEVVRCSQRSRIHVAHNT